MLTTVRVEYVAGIRRALTLLVAITRLPDELLAECGVPTEDHPVVPGSELRVTRSTGALEFSKCDPPDPPWA